MERHTAGVQFCATMCYMVRRTISSTIGVRELRQNLSIYLDRVKTGEILTVTEHGAAVAILRPLPAADSPLDRLVAEGRGRKPRRDLGSLSRASAIKLERPLSALLADDRDDRL
jgi:prevent-host-death family protein